MKRLTYVPAQQCLAGRLTSRRQVLPIDCRGFSLVEMLVVLAIVAILATVSANYYGEYVTSANRTEAHAALSEAAGSLEKCKVLYGVYNSADCNVTLPITTENNYYSITGVRNATTFALTATPVAGGRQATDGKCTTLMLSHTGETSATGSETAACW